MVGQRKKGPGTRQRGIPGRRKKAGDPSSGSLIRTADAVSSSQGGGYLLQ